MMKKILFDEIKNHKYDLIIYPAEFFELRIQEEIVRSEENNSSFVYIEILFNSLKDSFDNHTTERRFWESAIRGISIKKRGSDVFGFLQEENGLGLLLLDSKIDGWLRLQDRINEFCKITIGDISDILKKGTKAFVYPSCIEGVAGSSPPC